MGGAGGVVAGGGAGAVGGVAAGAVGGRGGAVAGQPLAAAGGGRQLRGSPREAAPRLGTRRDRRVAQRPPQQVVSTTCQQRKAPRGKSNSFSFLFNINPLMFSFINFNLY